MYKETENRCGKRLTK